MTGTTIGRYELLDKLGEGGMGVVYRARDAVLNRFIALKFLPTDTGLDDDRKRRFLQEAQVASALNHPNIVTIYEVGLVPPHEFIAMEYEFAGSVARCSHTAERISLPGCSHVRDSNRRRSARLRTP